MIAMPRFSSFMVGGLIAGAAAMQVFAGSLHPGPTGYVPHGSQMAAAGARDFPARGKALEIDKPTPAQPARCEAVVSTIIDPTLSRLVGRCFAWGRVQ